MDFANRILPPLAALLLFCCTITCSAQSEQISTWRFAENIGLRGVQFSYYDFKPVGKTKGQLMAQSSTAVPLNNQYNPATLSEDNLRQALINYNVIPLNRYRTVNLSAALLPFRRSSFRFLRKTEWQIGISYSEVNSNSEIVYEPQADSIITAQFNFSMKDVSLVNSLLFESKALGRTKLYAGPSFNISISPDFSHSHLATSYSSIKRFNYHTNSEVMESPLSVPKLSYSLGLRAGVKFSLGCRLNLFAEADLQNRWLQYKGFQVAYQYIGYGLGIRYKFVRPDENGQTPSEFDGNNVFW